jgi:hypothetical protein
MDITLLIIIFSIMLVLLVLWMLLRMRANNDNAVSAEPDALPAPLPKAKTCLLCGHVLVRGEKMKSEEYKAEDHSIIHMRGCPHCVNGQRERTCPVCKKVMPQSAYLVGRMWKTKRGTMHLRIKGCTGCV